MGTPRHGAEGPTSTKAPRCGSVKTDSHARAKLFIRGLTSSVLQAPRYRGAIAGGLVARIRPAERRRSAELRETHVYPREHDLLTHHARTASKPPYARI
jgi:hypothetical protein